MSEPEAALGVASGAQAAERAARRRRRVPEEIWVIEPQGPGLLAEIQELWRYRHLFRFFAVRALRKRYARTVLGRSWLFIRPMVPIVVSTMVFGNVMGIQSEGLPYFLFVMVGMTHWSLFSTTLMWCTRSLELNRGMLKRIYFPRVVLPIATMAPGLLDFGIYLGAIGASALYYVVVRGEMYLRLGPSLLLAAGVVVVSLLLSLGIGLFTSIFGLKARDVRFSLGYFLNVWFFLTPVVYPLTYVPDDWRWAVYLNPMAALVETFRWATLGIGELNRGGLAISALTVGIILACGLWFFRTAEATSADRV